MAKPGDTLVSEAAVEVAVESRLDGLGEKSNPTRRIKTQVARSNHSHREFTDGVLGWTKPWVEFFFMLRRLLSSLTTPWPWKTV